MSELKKKHKPEKLFKRKRKTNFLLLLKYNLIRLNSFYCFVFVSCLNLIESTYSKLLSNITNIITHAFRIDRGRIDQIWCAYYST